MACGIQISNLIQAEQNKACPFHYGHNRMLDNFASVKEAVGSLKDEPFVLVSDYIPGTDKFTSLHLSISDAYGDNAIFEYIDGKPENPPRSYLCGYD